MAIYVDPFGAALEGSRLARADYLDEIGEIRRQRAMDLEYTMNTLEPAMTYERDQRLFRQRLDEMETSNRLGRERDLWIYEQNRRDAIDRQVLEGVITGRLEGGFADPFLRRVLPEYSGGFGVTRYDPVTGQPIPAGVGAQQSTSPFSYGLPNDGRSFYSDDPGRYPISVDTPPAQRRPSITPPPAGVTQAPPAVAAPSEQARPGVGYVTTDPRTGQPVVVPPPYQSIDLPSWLFADRDELFESNQHDPRNPWANYGRQ